MANNKLTRAGEMLYPMLPPKGRLLIWEKALGVWKHRLPDPIKELKKMRREWERKLSHLKRR